MVTFTPETSELGFVTTWNEPGFWKSVTLDPIAGVVSLNPFDTINKVPMSSAARLLKSIQYAIQREFGLPLQLTETKEEAAIGAACWAVIESRCFGSRHWTLCCL